ncbi:PREDICTED: mucin-5AC-like [Camelina sativa]|uniref:Mucin-5AC-like n=1 Tax=Camelina sativa TaxID=90675 RepID=A0ABM0TS74_CAMSA|nr:PREDICTED: mucin-5AC-like [Camelina sativa]
MSIEFSEPECRNCYHCRTSGILNIQESELSNVTGSSVNSMPVSPRPVQALGYDSALNVSTSTTSSPVHISSPFGFSPDVSSAPTQALGPTTSGFCASTALTPPKFGSVQPPVQATFGSGAPSTSTSFSFLPFGYVPAPPRSSPFGPAQDMPWGINSFSTGCGIEWVRSDVGVWPASSSSTTTTTVVFGTTPVSVSSQFGPVQDFPKTTSVCASSTSAPTKCEGSLARCGLDYSPASSSLNLFGPNPSTTASLFGTSAASVSSPFQPVQHSLRNGVPKLTCVCVSSTKKNPGKESYCYIGGRSSKDLGEQRLNVSGKEPSLIRQMQVSTQICLESEPYEEDLVESTVQEEVALSMKICQEKMGLD